MVLMFGDQKETKGGPAIHGHNLIYAWSLPFGSLSCPSFWPTPTG